MRIHQVRTPKEKRDEILAAYFGGENSYEELGQYYGVKASLIRTWVSRYRNSEKAVSLQPESRPAEDMARKKNKQKEEEKEKSPEVLSLEARVRELELQNLALNTLIDVAERNGIEIRKKSGAKQ